jgi:oligopeptide transport system ATP-binding protein
MPLLEVRDLVKVYHSNQALFGSALQARGTRAVAGVSFDIYAGETLGLVGESGCGKTTLGRMILRLIQPTSGSVCFDGRDVLAASPVEMRRLRRDMQFIFQDPFASLNPRMTVEQIVAEPLKIHGSDGTRAALGRFPHEFSGGQRQRIGIARALILHPKFVVCDEPVSALDVSVGAQIVNLLKSLQGEFGLTFLFISHSMPVVRYLSDRIAVMRRGEIVEMGSTEQIIFAPAHEYTRALLASTPEPEYKLS